MSKKSSTVTTDPSILQQFRPKKTFNYHQNASITSLTFDDSGQYLISAGIDKSIQLYDVHKGIHTKDIQSQKYGAHIARFTHKDLNCLYATTPTVNDDVDHSIRYLSLSDKKYIRYFKGHKAQVVSLQVDPVHDTFITSSLDKSVKLWDIRLANPTGNIDCGNSCLLAYDPHGIMFVVAKQDGQNTMDFYDTKHFQNGPFLSCNVPSSTKWTNVEFANHGAFILVSTSGFEHHIIDAFLGNLLTTLQVKSSTPQFNSTYPISSTSCLSPCGRYAIAGSPQLTLLFFDLSNLKCSKGGHSVKDHDNPRKLLPFKVTESNQGIPKILAFNPKLLTLATADNTVSLWQP